MLTLREAVRTAGLGLIALAMIYTTLQVTFSPTHASQGPALAASIEAFP